MRDKPSHELLQVLRSVPLFAGLNSKELTRVDRLLDTVERATGDVLTEEGTVGRQAFIVLSGRASVTIGGRPVATLGPGEVIGEMALLDRQPRTATVTALEPMKVFVIDPRSFSTLLAEPAIARRMLDAEVGRLRIADSAPNAPVSRESALNG
jgi:CRP/FNR family transcriptional regulator, cyclic AMP receptor protein